MPIRQNIRKIRQQLEAYPHATLLVVTKNRTSAEIGEVLAAGIRAIGENRVQEMEEKYALIPAGIEKHLIGHLQSNKVKKAVRLFDVIQSVDSLEIARKIGQECQQIGKIMPVFLQVNISAETQKSGFKPEQMAEMYQKIAQIPGLKISGLMCIPKAHEDKENTGNDFQKMKSLHTKIIQKFSLDPEAFELSMGMSADYQMALAAGATMVRIGSAVFAAEKRV